MPSPTSHVDPRSPFVINTHELGRRAGAMLELNRELPAPGGWELELVRVPPGSPVELDLRLESVVDGVLVTAAVHVELSAECGRCLEPVGSGLDLDLSELYAYEPDPDDEETPVLEGDLLDLEPALRDAVVLALPFNPLCSPDCAGLCPTCGVRLADAGPEHSHDSVDPRWAALQALQEPDRSR